MIQLSSDAYHKLLTAEHHVEALLSEVGKDGLRALRGFEGRLLETGDATLHELRAMETRCAYKPSLAMSPSAAPGSSAATTIHCLSCKLALCHHVTGSR